LKDSVRVVFNVQSGLQKSNDYLLYELHIRKQLQSGIVKISSVDFVTTQPIHVGQKPVDGHMEATVIYENDKSDSISAGFTPTGFSGTWTGTDGKTLNVIWDSDGNVVS
jgi:hypothetical protein